MKRFNIYLVGEGTPRCSTDIEKEAWEAIDKLPFGAPYEVRDEFGSVCSEFVPF